jgi:hypothetical protein
VIIAAIVRLLPEINEVPEGFSAVVLWRFRLASIGTQLVLWTALGVLFGLLTERRLRKDFTGAGEAEWSPLVSKGPEPSS